jgi:DNA-directed RNA polymerase subunit alpha
MTQNKSMYELGEALDALRRVQKDETAAAELEQAIHAEMEVKMDDKMDDKNIPLEELELSIRAYNNCRRAGIRTVSDILTMPLGCRAYIGHKTAIEVAQVLKSRYGIELEEVYGE